MPKTFKILIVLLSFTSLILANLYQPHVYPVNGPFFEGWYSRLQDANSNASFGILFGRVLPQTQSAQPQNLSYVSILYNKGDGSPIQAFDGFPKTEEIKVTDLLGNNIASNPSLSGTDLGFVWQAENFGYFKSDSQSTEFSFEYDGVSIKALLGQPKPWGPNGEGPAGWTEVLPLPLHWFVHSLGSPIKHLEFKNEKTGDAFTTNAGFAHQEKNWGAAFPKAWIWIQTSNVKENSEFVMSGGPLNVVGDLAVEAHLIGFRHGDLALNFHPQDSIVSKKLNPCEGKLSVEVQNLQYKLTLDISADVSSFTGLLGPSVEGFKLMCYESYTSQATVKVYQRTFLGENLISTVNYKNAALEFGGDYYCRK